MTRDPGIQCFLSILEEQVGAEVTLRRPDKDRCPSAQRGQRQILLCVELDNARCISAVDLDKGRCHSASNYWAQSDMKCPPPWAPVKKFHNRLISSPGPPLDSNYAIKRGVKSHASVPLRYQNKDSLGVEHQPRIANHDNECGHLSSSCFAP